MKVSKKLVHDALPDVVEDLYRQINELVQRVDYLSMDVSRLAARIDEPIRMPASDIQTLHVPENQTRKLRKEGK